MKGKKRWMTMRRLQWGYPLITITYRWSEWYSSFNIIQYNHIVLYYIVLYCIVLYCIVLHCIVLPCLVLICLVMSCLVLTCLVLHRLFLHRIFLYLILWCTVSHNDASYFMKLYSDIRTELVRTSYILYISPQQILLRIFSFHTFIDNFEIPYPHFQCLFIRYGISRCLEERSWSMVWSWRF